MRGSRGKARDGVVRRENDSHAVAQVTACLAEEMVEYHLGLGHLHCVRKISFPLTGGMIPCCHVWREESARVRRERDNGLRQFDLALPSGLGRNIIQSKFERKTIKAEIRRLDPTRRVKTAGKRFRAKAQVQETPQRCTQGAGYAMRDGVRRDIICICIISTVLCLRRVFSHGFFCNYNLGIHLHIARYV